jgi:hypothetical protein
MHNNVIDIVERSQRQHALQEERELKNFHASTSDAVAPGLPDKNESPKSSIFETEEVRIWTVAVRGWAEWSVPHDGRARMIVTLGRMRHLPREGDSAFPARWTWVPANSDFKVPNEADQTRNLMIVEFNDANHQESSQNRKEI